MKNKDLKKGRESIIGKIIYGFLLFMPLLAILSTILYTTFNKNAYLSMGSEYPQQTINYTAPSQLVENRLFIVTYQGIAQDNSQIIGFKSISLDLETITGTQYNYNAINFLNNGRIQFRVYDFDNSTGTNLTTINYTEEFNNFSFTSNGKYNSNNLTFSTNLAYKIQYQIFAENKLSDSFYYAVDKVEQSNLFNWSKTTIIYTGIQNTCTQLGITNTFTPMLLAYWLLISVVYILYDIILMILIILHNRVHRLQDSMS